jgi:hypothetical protein
MEEETFSIPLVGGPCAGFVKVSLPPPNNLALAVDEDFRQVGSDPPYAHVVYRLERHGMVPIYAYCSCARPNKQPFTIELVDGPKPGIIPAPQPAQCLPDELNLPLATDGSAFDGAGQLMGMATFRKLRVGDKWKFTFVRLDESQATRMQITEQVQEHIVQQAIDSFYANPNYDIYSMKPTGDHVQVPVEVGHRRGHVDEGIAVVITHLWNLDVDTLGSCQELPRGHKHAGQAYVDFIRVREAKWFYELLTSHGVKAEFGTKAMTFKKKCEDPNEAPKSLSLQNAMVTFDPKDISAVAAILKNCPPSKP